MPRHWHPAKILVEVRRHQNALACERDGQRYILYNTDFLKDCQADARSKWAAYGVLAHEIGHHVNFHNFNEDNNERRKELELEADRFSGSVLRLLGATKDEGRSAVSNLVNKAETATHPPPTARLLSVVNGWNDQDDRLRKMGVTGVNDPSGTSGSIPIVRDRDGDGIPDDADDCPYKKGEARWKGCPDSDGDGIPDNKDKCPYLRGELQDEGCPPTDRDNDNIPDKTDRCPDQAGTIRYRGCPDTDNDGVPDPDDRCPKEKGDPNYGGCAAPSPAGAGPGVGASAAVDKLIKNRKSGFSMKAVPRGTYTMGSPTDESGRRGDECQHSETVAAFKIGFYEVTQADWYEVMNTRPSRFKDCDDCPVESVSWDAIQDFLKKLKEKTGQQFRLLTEAEWEFAARGGNDSKKYLYAGGNTLTDVAWCGSNSDSKTHPVGTKKANELGLYDMSGNVWESCQDVYKAYPCDNQSPGDGTVRVLRGGSWNSDSNHRSAVRDYIEPALRSSNLGFRLAQD